jgi:Lysine methyltransferase
VELGCGTGLVGLVFAAFGASVLLTDKRKALVSKTFQIPSLTWFLQGVVATLLSSQPFQPTGWNTMYAVASACAYTVVSQIIGPFPLIEPPKSPK